jgi:CO/xanthine dehydrogenase Mo-binding subunit
MSGLIRENELSRRQFLKGGGALVVGFSMAGAALSANAARSAAPAPIAPLGGPWTTPSTNSLDSWLKITQDGKVLAYGSRVDSGQGTTTGFVQIIADELDVPFESVTLIAGDTARVPNNGDIGSASGIIYQSQPLRYAAAEARLALLNFASKRFGVPVGQLSVSDGVVSVTANPAQKATYGELIGSQQFNVTLHQVSLPGVPVRTGGVAYVSDNNAQLKTPSQYKVIGTSAPRFDIPDKVTGKFTYAQNVRVPGMVHARLIPPPGPKSNLVSINGWHGSKPPGLISVFSKGNFVAVVAEQEWQAIQAMSNLDVTWSDPGPVLSGNGNLNGSLRTSPVAIPDVNTTRAARYQGQSTNPNRGNVAAGLAGAAKVLSADYYFPVHTHGSIGPAAAVADVSGGQAVVFSPAGSIYLTQSHVAGVLGIPVTNVRVISTEGSGQYGKVSLSEDSGPAAALISQAVGRPVRLQLMRQHDMVTDPYGVPYSYRFQGGIDRQGNIVGFSTEFWTWAINPQTEGPTLTDMLTGAAQPGPFRGQSIQALGGGDINAYEFPNESFLGHHVAPQLRVGSGNMRSPKRIQGNFAVESFIDELAAAAAMDPIDFRLQQIKNTQTVVATAEPNFDPSHYQRQIATLQGLKDAMAWESRPSPNPKATKSGDVVTGRGVATMGNYTNMFGSIGAEVEVNMRTGRVRVTRIVNVVDPGLIINPRAARNTVAQGVLFALSRTLHEELRFNRTEIKSRDWVSYPILRFVEVPDQEVILINRPEYWGGGLGEGNEIMVSAVIGNAIFDATGVRLREVPFTPAKVRAAFAAVGKKV